MGDDSIHSPISVDGSVGGFEEDTASHQNHAQTQTDFQESQESDFQTPTVTVRINKCEFLPLFNILITLVAKRLNKRGTHRVARRLVKRSIKTLNRKSRVSVNK